MLSVLSALAIRIQVINPGMLVVRLVTGRLWVMTLSPAMCSLLAAKMQLQLGVHISVSHASGWKTQINVIIVSMISMLTAVSGK